MNDGLDRRMVGLTGGRLPTPTAACDDGRERVDGSTKWCTWRNPPPRWTSRRCQPDGLMNPPTWMRCDRRSLKLRMLIRPENGQGGQGRSQKSGLDLASQCVGDARFGLECVHVVCDGGDGRRRGKRANLRNTVLVVDEVSLCIRRDSSRPRQPVSPWRSGLLGTSGSTQWVELGRHVLSQPVMALFSLHRVDAWYASQRPETIATSGECLQPLLLPISLPHSTQMSHKPSSCVWQLEAN